MPSLPRAIERFARERILATIHEKPLFDDYRYGEFLRHQYRAVQIPNGMMTHYEKPS
jgi:hypothetical protein